MVKKNYLSVVKLLLTGFLILALSSCGGNRNYYSTKAGNKGCACPGK